MPLSTDPAKRARQLENLRPAPPAPAGHQRNLRHGGYAQIAATRLEGKQREVYDALAADAPLRDENDALPAHDAAQVSLLAQCLCRIEDVAANIRDFGLFDQKTGDVRPAVDLEARLRREAASYLDALGMTPKARAALGLDLARTAQATMADEIADAKAAREARERQPVALDAEAVEDEPTDEGGAAA